MVDSSLARWPSQHGHLHSRRTISIGTYTVYCPAPGPRYATAPINIQVTARADSRGVYGPLALDFDTCSGKTDADCPIIQRPTFRAPSFWRWRGLFKAIREKSVVTRENIGNAKRDTHPRPWACRCCISGDSGSFLTSCPVLRVLSRRFVSLLRTRRTDLDF